jgi:glycosyltransferase involved in cell wall biosynthesis
VITEPTFSICIPNYNYGRYIGETIRSVLEQTYQNFEIIVADNASTDNSVEVVQSFKDPRIRLIQNRYNIGFAPNLQRVTMEARGDFINLLSSDDLMCPNALETYMQALQEVGWHGEPVVLMSDAYGIDEHSRFTRRIVKAADSFARVTTPPGEPSGHTSGLSYSQYRGRDVLRDGLRRLDTVGVFCTITYTRTLWEAVEGYNSVRTISPDKHFNYKLLSQDPRVIYVHEPLFCSRDYVSDNRAAVATTVRQAMDDYLYTLEYPEEFLRNLGLSKRHLQRTFLRRTLREVLVQLGQRNYPQAFRLFAFCFATYPGETITLPPAYLSGMLLALGPLALLIAPPLRQFYRRLLQPKPRFQQQRQPKLARTI